MSTTKRKRRPIGPGDRAIDRFLRSIVALDGGVVLEDDEKLRIDFKDDRPPVTVKRVPADPAEWEARLEHLEKQAAIVLCNPPVIYSMVWGKRATARPVKEMLRLSVGISLSIGAPLSRRYVITLTRGARKAIIEEGGLPPVDNGVQTTILTTFPIWVEQSMKLLSAAVVEACQNFHILPDVQDAVRRISEKRRAELANLEHLYATRQGHDGHLYGLPESGTEGSASIEAEQRRLQRVVLERYSLSVRVRILSLGVLQGSIPVSSFGE